MKETERCQLYESYIIIIIIIIIIIMHDEERTMW
jgi:hypothetical protein